MPYMVNSDFATCIQHPSSVSLPIPGYPVSKSFFTHPSKCYSSSFSVTWSFLSAPARFHLSSVAYSSRIHARTPRILAQYGISFGAVLPPFYHVRGWPFIRICRVLSRGRLRTVFKNGYRTHFSWFHLFERSSEETSNNHRCTSEEDDEPLRPLMASDLSRYPKSFTMPTEAETKDKGKSDWLVESLVLLQTSWFVMQRIARGIKHLPVTHLEIVTLAYAAINFVIYIFWWNKTLNVNRPVRVLRESGESEPNETQPQLISEARKLTWKSVFYGLETILQFIIAVQDGDISLSHEDKVPRFWASSTDNNAGIADLVVLGVGVCFGAIHCIAWGFPFPKHTELLIWRISSAAITAVPVYIPLVVLLSACLDHTDFDIISGIAALSVLPAGILYVIARAVTLVLAFTSLRDLPPGAFDTVHWTTFIPHV